MCIDLSISEYILSIIVPYIFLLRHPPPGERDRLSESFLDVSATNESLRAELAKYSKLNETLEEENRLLKEALGLDNGEDDDDDGDDENNGE